MIIKTNLNAPPYHTLLIELCSVQHWDNTPTTVHIKANCLDEKGNQVHEVAATTSMYFDMRKSDALLKDVPGVLGLLKRLPRPNKLVLSICDLGAYVYITHQACPHFYTTRTWCRKIRKFLKRYDIPYTIELGRPELSLQFEKYMFDNSMNYKVAHTLEQSGQKYELFHKKERGIRRRLGLWTS
jgi:hypothetical protein